MSDYDDTHATTHDAHPKAKKRDVVEPKEHATSHEPARGVDSTAPGQALAHLIKAGDSLAALEAITSHMLQKAQTDKGAESAVLEMQQLLPPHRDTANQELAATWQLLSHNTGMEAERRHVSYDEIKAETLAHPNMGHAAEKATLALAHVVSNIDGIAEKLPAHAQEFQSVSGLLIGSLRHVSANLGLEAKGYNDLLNMVEIKVHVSTVNLQTGLPRTMIDEAVFTTAAAFDRNAANIMTAVREAIGIISREELEKNDDALPKIWEIAKTLLTRASKVVSGVAWPIALAEKVVGKILDYEAADQKRLVGNDLANFVTFLNNKIEELDDAAKAPGGDTDILSHAKDLDARFLALGKESPDAWKFGDPTVVGVQADFLKSIVNEAQNARTSIPPSRTLLAEFLTGYVNVNFKERNRSALRSPFSEPTYQDGYAHVNLILHANALAGGWTLRGDTATLHCPNSNAVASNLMTSIKDFSLAKLDTNIIVDIELDEGSRDQRPDLWRDERVRTVRLNSSHMVASPESGAVWAWLQTYTHQAADHILSDVTKIEGD